jgi:hypothetical protein
VDADRIEEILRDAEAQLASGGSPDLAPLGFWKVVATLKTDPSFRDRYAERVARIDREAFTKWALLAVPVWVGATLLAIGTAAGLTAVGVSYYLDAPWNGLLLLLGTGILLTTLHGLAHLVVGWIQGMRFTHWFIGSLAKPQPGVKVDYASYLAVPARRRAWMHASGAIATKVVPFAMLAPAFVMGAPWWTTTILVVVGIGTVATDALWSVHSSDWKKFRREMRFAGRETT